MRFKYYMTKTIIAQFRSQLEMMGITFMFAIVFTILTFVAVKYAVGPLFPLALIAGIGCWVLFFLELYYFIRHRIETSDELIEDDLSIKPNSDSH